MADTYTSIIEAVQRGDLDHIRLVSKCLDMADMAKQMLRDKGYGWTGLDIVKTCELVPSVDKKDIRKSGYYWVKINDTWCITYLSNLEYHQNCYFQEIDERRIERQSVVNNSKCDIQPPTEED